MDPQFSNQALASWLQKSFFIPKLAIHLKHSAAWYKIWNQEYPQPRQYAQYKADFLARVEKAVHGIIIM